MIVVGNTTRTGVRDLLETAIMIIDAHIVQAGTMASIIAGKEIAIGDLVLAVINLDLVLLDIVAAGPKTRTKNVMLK